MIGYSKPYFTKPYCIDFQPIPKFMDGLCTHCPKLKYLYLSQECDVGAIKNISVDDLKPFAHEDKFHYLESIRLYYNGASFLKSIEHKLKYINDYLIAKCPKINGILIELSPNPELEKNLDYDLPYEISLSICSASYVNFYLKDSCLIEEKVKLDIDEYDDWTNE